MLIRSDKLHSNNVVPSLVVQDFWRWR